MVAGPTATGKSALAVDLAEATGGVVINADSMQVYRELSILTARPGPAALARVPHRLYGVLPAAEPCSAARWRGHALAEIAEALVRGRMPVLVGGTGLYLRALIEGLAEIPPVPEAVRREVAERLAALGGDAFRAELARRDPASAARLAPGDTQRLIRAAEVVEATGRPLGAWQADPGLAPPPGLRFAVTVLLPAREPLYAACEARFAAMMEAGALDEVRALDALRLDPSLPAMKALGVPPLRAHLAGEIDRATAVERAVRETRRYAKRQTTWFRHQLPHGADNVESLEVYDEQYSESLSQAILRKVRKGH